LSVSGLPSAFDRFKSEKALAFERIFTQRLKRAALPSIRFQPQGLGNTSGSIPNLVRGPTDVAADEAGQPILDSFRTDDRL
jgi:hypothetical protein